MNINNNFDITAQGSPGLDSIKSKQQIGGSKVSFGPVVKLLNQKDRKMVLAI